MSIHGKNRFWNGVRSTWLAGLALAGLWSAGCTDDLELGEEGPGAAPAPGVMAPAEGRPGGR